MSSGRTTLLRRPPVVSVGCGCRRPKIPDVFRRLKKPPDTLYRRRNQVYQASSTASSWETAVALSTDGDGSDSGPSSPRLYRARPERASGRVRESVAVVKDSDDPYLDFRRSMLQMILEKEIFARDDLRELLHRFLSLNSPEHHEVIVRAFTEIWNGAYSGPRASADGRRRPKGCRTWEPHA